MTPTITPIEMGRFLEQEALDDLCRRPGPWVTILLPGYRPGSQAATQAGRMKHLLAPARELLKQLPPGPDAAAILAPLEALAEQPFADAGGGPGAVFSSPGFFSFLRLNAPVAECVRLGNYPLIKPLLAGVQALRDFYILELSRKHLRLLHYQRGSCQEVPLPEGVPQGMDEAGGLDTTAHNESNHSTSGGPAGVSRGVRFGTGSDHEAKGEHLHHFFGIVDRGLKTALHGAPLLLAGVTEEVAAYRRASKYPQLLESEIAASGGVTSLLETEQHAQAAARDHLRRQALAALREYTEMPERHKTLHKSDEVLAAAVEGRVHCLLGAADLDLECDPINAAAVETIKHGGRVYLLPAADLGAAGPLAAVLRY